MVPASWFCFYLLLHRARARYHCLKSTTSRSIMLNSSVGMDGARRSSMLDPHSGSLAASNLEANENHASLAPRSKIMSCPARRRHGNVVSSQSCLEAICTWYRDDSAFICPTADGDARLSTRGSWHGVAYESRQ